MFDPNSPRDIKRLNDAVRSNYRNLSTYRTARRDLIKEYVGSAYGKAGSEMPVNLLAQMVDIYLMQLAGSNPRVILPTTRKDILPFVADLEAVVNQELDDMNFDKILRRWVQEAIFCIGIIKCGLIDGEYLEVIPGQPQPTQDYFIDVVDFDDFVFDTDATTWDRAVFIGDRYKIDYDVAMDNEEYNPDAKASLRTREDNRDDEDGDRTSDIGVDRLDYPSSENDIRRTTWVWDIAMPEEGIVVTIPHAPVVTAALKVVEWEGPSTMPYKMISFSDVPGNIMPLAPGQVLRSLNKSVNALYRKLVEQAKRQKTLGLYRLGNDDDVEAIKKAKDGDLVGVEHPDVIKEIRFGGAAPENISFSIEMRSLFSQLAGNLDAMGGLGPQSDTFRQDAMIQATVSKKSAKMATTVVNATVEVVRDLMYRIWNDPIRTYSARRGIAGTDVEIAVEIGPDNRQGTFGDFNIRIEPYSMQYRSPQERSQELTQIMTTLVFPAMPFLQQQGIGVNMQKFFEYLSKYMALPELQNIFEYVGAPMPGMNTGEQSQDKTTNRVYERISRPGATAGGNDRTMQQLLMGGNPQDSQTASLGRPTGV